jgi:hypothetical protein
MTHIYILYAAVGAVGAVAILISVLNWIRLSVTSGHIARLEAEIEKKAHEFDMIRREKADRAASHDYSAVDEEDADEEPLGDCGQHSAESRGEGIEVYRNVRGRISLSVDEPAGEDSEPGGDENMSDHEDRAAPPWPAQPAASLPSSGRDQSDFSAPGQSWQQAVPADHRDRGQPPATEYPPATPEADSDAGFAPEDGDSADIMDVVEEGATPQPSPDMATRGGDAVTVALYSDRIKDVDFDRSITRLRRALTHMRRPAVTLDFENVLFLYENEQLAIEQLARELETLGGTMIFVNCQPELVGILRTNTLLARYVSA